MGLSHINLFFSLPSPLSHYLKDKWKKVLGEDKTTKNRSPLDSGAQNEEEWLVTTQPGDPSLASGSRAPLSKELPTSSE